MTEDEIREQIAQMIMGKYFDYYDDELREQCRELADAILAIPAIEEGLKLLADQQIVRELEKRVGAIEKRLPPAWR